MILICNYFALRSKAHFKLVLFHSNESRAEAYPGYINVFSPRYIYFMNESFTNDAGSTFDVDTFVSNYTNNNVSVEILRPGNQWCPICYFLIQKGV